MVRISGKVVLVLLVLLTCSTAWADEQRATPDEARRMAERAAELIAQVGPQRAFTEFMRTDGPFHDRELFVVVLDRTGTVVAHGERRQYVGRNMVGLRDVRGQPFVAEMLSVPHSGFVEYAWQNPLTQVVERKRSYVVPGSEYVLFVGAYLGES